MKIEELYDLTLREVCENYVVLHNLECGFIYGIVSFDLLEEFFEKYNISEEYPEAIHGESILPDEVQIDGDECVLDRTRLVKIMESLGISKKK